MFSKSFQLPCAFAGVSLAFSSLFAAVQPDRAQIDFARDIQPILATRCYDCHGAEKAKAGFRLTSRVNALLGGESGAPAIIPGESAKSGLIQRVLTEDEADVMPQKADRLPAAEVALLKQWIDEGAVWPENVQHWAYVKPVRPALPHLGATASGALNAIDHFVLARLKREGLSLSPETDRARWLRRVSLDLVGLPPTPDQLVAFLADDRAGDAAYEQVVDRLLASPQYGERWARPWLDLARYADSHGFQRDDLREIWPYRDWVIRALNADMGFDQFTVWQLAGDLLPRNEKMDTAKNLDPLIATGFHRAAPTNVEAGTDQEEGRVNQVFDRVNTTAAVWLGSTLECAQCHNHKYDPFSQKEYYQLFSFFNHTAQETDFTSPKAKAALKFVGPYLEVPDPAQEPRRKALQTQLTELEEPIRLRTAELLPGFDSWAQTALARSAAAAQLHPLEVTEFESSGGSEHTVQPDGSVLLTETAPERDTYKITVRTKLVGITGLKLEALTDDSLPGKGPGRGDAVRSNFVLNNLRVTAAPAGGAAQPVKFIKATASFSQTGFGVENLLRLDNSTRGGWAIGPQFQRDHWAIFEPEVPLGDPAGTTLTFTLVQNFGMARTIGRVRLSALTGVTGASSQPADVAAALRLAPAERSEKQAAKLRDYYLAQDPVLAELNSKHAKLTAELRAGKGAQTLVMRELGTPRPTAVLKRGSFLEPGEAVEPGVPAVLHAMTSGNSPATKASRLELARWLVDSANPLVARVTVNRWWAEFFGRGIVSTLEDFGLKGEAPTHPELLDWLAVEFTERGWSMKHIHKLIVLSATYRQRSYVTPELLARDDQNKLLARGPRFRLDAEAIRDNALAAAGLLSLKQGGPPVRPYQPPGLWESKVGGDRVTYDVSAGEDAWRRGVYTVWKRSSPYPSFVNFDATSRTTCTVQRSRSNTPLQALTLLNDPVYVEAAAALARRALTGRPAASDDVRIRFAFQLCLTREPTAAETDLLRKLLEQQRVAHRAKPAPRETPAAPFTPPPDVSAEEFGAWRAVATALLNLDEMITKG